MFCKFCGKEFDDDAVICPGCGKLTDKGCQVVKPVSAASASPAVQPKAQKKEKVPRGSVIAFVAFAVYILGETINTTVSTSINRNMLLGVVTINESFIAIMSGILSVICLGVAITSVALVFAERAAAIRRVFPLCMLLISVAYFIEFICLAVSLSAFAI